MRTCRMRNTKGYFYPFLTSQCIRNRARQYFQFTQRITIFSKAPTISAQANIARIISRKRTAKFHGYVYVFNRPILFEVFLIQTNNCGLVAFRQRIATIIRISKQFRAVGIFQKTIDFFNIDICFVIHRSVVCVRDIPIRKRIQPNNTVIRYFNLSYNVRLPFIHLMRLTSQEVNGMIQPFAFCPVSVGINRSSLVTFYKIIRFISNNETRVRSRGLCRTFNLEFQVNCLACKFRTKIHFRTSTILPTFNQGSSTCRSNPLRSFGCSCSRIIASASIFRPGVRNFINITNKPVPTEIVKQYQYVAVRYFTRNSKFYPSIGRIGPRIIIEEAHRLKASSQIIIIGATIICFKTGINNITRERVYRDVIAICIFLRRRYIYLKGNFRNISPIFRRHIRINRAIIFNKVCLPLQIGISTVKFQRIARNILIRVIRLTYILLIRNRNTGLRLRRNKLSIIKRVDFVFVDVRRTEFFFDIRAKPFVAFHANNLNIVFTRSRDITFFHKVNMNAVQYNVVINRRLTKRVGNG